MATAERLTVAPDSAPNNLGGGAGGGDGYGERLARLEEKVEHLATKNDISKLEILIVKIQSELVATKWALGALIAIAAIVSRLIT